MSALLDSLKTYANLSINEGLVDTRIFAQALKWNENGASIEGFSAVNTNLPQSITRAFVGGQRAMIFAGTPLRLTPETFNNVALFAYHSTIEWGVITDIAGVTFFNSHWVRNNQWFHLPHIEWTKIEQAENLFDAVTPYGLSRGYIDELAIKYYEPENQLLPVDDALVDRLDHWRGELIRYTKSIDNVDELLQTLFAQLFVLRSIEDRNLAPQLPGLSGALKGSERIDVARVLEVFSEARQSIQSELFENIIDFQDFPESVLSGIVKDLYYPTQLPGERYRYNFAWIDANILGRAYEKYLSTILVPKVLKTPQLTFWEQPIRDVERVSTARKVSGVYYTPSYLVNHLTEECLDLYFESNQNNPDSIPRIIDLSCGSGSFLASAADSLIRRLRGLDANRNWGREIISRKSIVGIDVDKRAVTFAKLQLWLRLAEEPQPLPLPSLDDVIICGDSLKDETWANLPNEYQLILGNPPFIPSADVQSRQELISKFRTAQGKFDYSYLFVEMALKKLTADGFLGLVIPNRLFRNRDAATIREILTTETNLLSVIDFGTNEVFKGTSSYIGAFIARKKEPTHIDSKQLRFIRVTSLPPRFVGAFLSAASRATGALKTEYLIAYFTTHPRGKYDWAFLSPSSKAARVQLTEKSETLPYFAEIYQGVKTGANDIFVVTLESLGTGHLAHIRNGLGDIEIIETAILRPVVYGSEIQRYNLVRPSRYLIYPYHNNRVILEQEFLELYPQALNYLLNYRELLTRRATVTTEGKNWYELQRPRDENWLNRKKLLIRDLATETSFALDDLGSTYSVNGNVVIPNDEQYMLPLLGYLNSKLANWFLSQITPSFRADFQKFETQHLANLPILRDVFEDYSISSALSVLVNSVLSSKESGNVALQSKYETEIDKLLCTIAGIDFEEIQ